MNDITTTATAWLLRHARDLSRPDALKQCTDYLVGHHDVSEDTAGHVALQALASLESVNQRSWIDIDACTSHLVVIRRQGKPPIAFTLTDLMRLHRRHGSRTQRSSLH
ncbi:MAG: hypothetical protein JJU06_13320 [Ectothiorhodospiraceae bacterium]|nr:hypothetical protein [Ectothiorhodospiraceae bacterium]